MGAVGCCCFYAGWVTESGVGCVCHRCGRRYRVDLLLPDALWAALAPFEMQCGWCMVEQLEDVAARADGFGYLRVVDGVVGGLGGLVEQA